MAVEKAKLISPLATQWQVFAAFGESLETALAPQPTRSVFKT